MYCYYYAAKTKALISCAITAQLICTFVFAYLKSRFSHDAAHETSVQTFANFESLYNCKVVLVIPELIQS